MGDLPGFDEFYAAVHHRDPFPWQSRLAATVADTEWPADVGVPTGLGKTAAIDIAVWALAVDALRPPRERRQSRRIWYVVDRRLLVDAASDHATCLAARLSAADTGPLAEVAAALRGLCATTSDPPLHVARLRGGQAHPAHGAGRVRDPAQPAVLCSTVAMYASRLLFRGYGVSRSMWPVEAAHAGTDALVLLDEAHLAPALQQLVDVLPDCDASATGVLRFPPSPRPGPGPAALLPGGRAYPLLVNLTATGTPGAFDLDDTDRAHPVVAQRLQAAKPTQLVTTTKDTLSDALAEQAWAAVQNHGTDTAAVVFTNTPARARQVADLLRARADGAADVVVLTGLLRDPDADQVRRFLLDPATGAPSGARTPRTRPLIVVATQTLEVGADLDFDVCVSETAGVRALVQRWGRLNRLGRTPGAAGVLVHPADGDDGLYGDEPVKVWHRLTAAGATEVDLGPQTVADTLGPAQDTPGRIGTLLPAHLWEFAKTTVPPPGAAPPEVFFDTIDDPDLRVSVMWRSVLPPAGQSLMPTAATAETVEVPLPDARTVLTALAEEGVAARVLTDDGTTVTAANPAGLRPGNLLVLPTTAGRYGPGGWNPQRTGTVTDLSPATRSTLHLTRDAVANLLDDPVDTEIAAALDGLRFDPDEGPDPGADARTARELAHLLATRQPDGPLAGATRAHIDRIGPDLDPVLRWDRARPAPAAAVDALDELSNAPRAGLLEHLAAVGEVAGRIAAAIGLPDHTVTAVAQAGRLHDLGKADPRFQRWLGTGPGTPPLAKSSMSPSAWRRAAQAAGWPTGARHELLSVQILRTWLDHGHQLPDADLVTHLVLAHHGNARPWCPTTSDGDPVTTTVEVEGQQVTTSTDTRTPDWTQPDRFRDLNEQHGYWGLALLEAVLRQADHRVSAVTEVI